MGVKVRQKDGAWWVFINHQGRRKAKKVGDRKAAHVVAEKLQAKLALGDLSALENGPPSPTLQEYAECWLASQIHLKLITLKNYRRSLVNHVFPVLGHTTLPAITRQAIQQLVAEKLPVKKPNTVRAFLNPLVACLNQAIEDGLLTMNPAARMMHRLGRRKPTLDDQEPDPEADAECGHHRHRYIREGSHQHDRHSNPDQPQDHQVSLGSRARKMANELRASDNADAHQRADGAEQRRAPVQHVAYINSDQSEKAADGEHPGGLLSGRAELRPERV